MRDVQRALVIGCGAAGRIHAKALRARGLSVAVYDADGDRAAALAKEAGTTIAPDPGGIEVDLCVIATPPVHHIEIADAELRRPDGRAVVIEKPLGLDPTATVEWAARIAATGLSVYVAESSAYGTPIQHLRAVIKSDVLGGPLVWRAAYATSYRPQAWSYDLAVGGGAFLEGGAHMLTVARLLFGKAVKWQGMVRNMAGGTGPDTGTVLVEYERGDMLSLSIAWGTEAAFTGGAVPGGNSWLIGSADAMQLLVNNDHEAMWDALLGYLRRGLAPLCDVRTAAGAVEDCWRCYAAAGVPRAVGRF